ncbi:hypothetical protein EDB80DRAFT_703437 [Ilyonectria destructans]|nr:hypothetical protein EDB80DRAFT_703437 [Ilyonectria destructans]
MKQVRIGCYSAFWGDSPLAVKQFLESEEPQLDYIVADYLAELTMGLLARSARSGAKGGAKGRPNSGYISEFLDLVLAPYLDLIVKKKVKVITNAGGLDPVGLKDAIAAHVEKRGLQDKIKVAAVSGDDLLSRRDLLVAEGSFEGFDPLNGAGAEEDGVDHGQKLLSINAYIGGEPIAVALNEGASIIVTGRCVDSALVVGALAHEYNWDFGTSQQSLDRLASASLAGHIIECGSQTTGGNYTDWKTSAFSAHGGWTNMGYPILTFNEDNSFTISKPEKTGGIVDCRAVCEQMLYEVLDPENYLLPDVVLDMTEVQLEQVGTDLVSVHGAQGKPPTPWLKCTAVEQRGFRVTVDILVCGEEAESKAKVLGEAIINRTNAIAAARQLDAECAITSDDYEVILIGAERSLGVKNSQPERREIALRVAVRHGNWAVLDILAKETAPFLTNSCPGICLLTSGRPRISPNFAATSVLVKKGMVTPLVHTGSAPSPTAVPLNTQGCLPPVPSNRSPQVSKEVLCGFLDIGLPRVKLLDIAVGRSGDKGDTANIAIIARSPKHYPYILEQVTSEVMYSALKHFIAPGGSVTRFEVPGVNAVNFVLTKSLGGGGLSSLRLDRQAKSYAQLALSTIFVHIRADIGITTRL